MTDHPDRQAAIIAQSDHYLLPLYKRNQIALVGGQGVWVEAADGRRYLDGLSGIAVNALGYGDPALVAAIQQAATGLLHTSNLYYTAPAAELAERLVQQTPWASNVFLCNSGTEAVEAALKFARRRSHNRAPGDHTGIVACTHSFHGRTFGALSMTAREAYRTPFMPLLPGVEFLEFNADSAQIEQLLNEQVGAVIVEPIQGEGGIHMATPAFLQALRARCDEIGATLIFDEIQCGLGRSGDMWAHTATGVTPDVLVVAKPLGGGLPIGAVLVNATVAQEIHYGDHGSTFGGNPLICSVANTVMERIAAPAFLSHVRSVGTALGTALRDLGERYEQISDVRGRGLMWGVECANHDVSPIIAAASDAGLLLASAGPDVIRIIPPLVISAAEVDELVQRLDSALHSVYS